MAKQFSLGRAEKLKSRKLIEDLFANGKSFGAFPLRVWYKFLPLASAAVPAEGEKSGLQTGVTVSKKYFKRAVHRNRIKRLLREAYRLQKKELLELLEKEGVKGIVFFVYVDKTLPDFTTIFNAMAKCLKTLIKKVSGEK